MNRNFPSLDETSAPEAARAALARARAHWGGIPTPLARYASSPALLAEAEEALAAFERTSLAPLEREVVAITTARRNGCEFCLRLHGMLLGKLAAPEELFVLLRQSAELGDARLEAVRKLTESVLDRTGDVDDDAWSAFVAAGFDHGQALEVVMGVACYTLTTYANRLTQAGE